MNKGFPDPQPLILIPGTSEFRFPTSASGVVSLNAGESVELFCSSALKNNATCQSNGQFLINGQSQNFSTYVCPKLPVSSVRRTGSTCYGGNPIVEIGFDLGDGRFPKIVTICHDEVNEANIWALNRLTPANNEWQHSFPRPNFQTPPEFFGGKNVDGLYTKNNQRAIFGQILGSQELANELVQLTGDVYLARGHMAAKADYIFGSHMDATFWFVNTAPQWQIFNGYNWERVESGVRELADARDYYLDVYTGTYGVMSVPDVNGVHRELYLYFDSNGNGLIPVPKIYYKVIIDEITELGIVIVGVNNPHTTETEIRESYTFCNDIADQVDWIDWNIHSVYNGYMYACEVSEFADSIGQLPPLTVTGILV